MRPAFAAAKRELTALSARIQAAANRRRGLEDVVWALLNSKQFVLRN